MLNSCIAFHSHCDGSSHHYYSNQWRWRTAVYYWQWRSTAKHLLLLLIHSHSWRTVVVVPVAAVAVSTDTFDRLFPPVLRPCPIRIWDSVVPRVNARLWLPATRPSRHGAHTIDPMDAQYTCFVEQLWMLTLLPHTAWRCQSFDCMTLLTSVCRRYDRLPCCRWTNRFFTWIGSAWLVRQPWNEFKGEQIQQTTAHRYRR